MKIPVFASFQGGSSQLGRLEATVRRCSVRASAGLVIGPRTEVDRVRNSYGIPEHKIARLFNPLDLTAWEPGNRTEAKNALGIPETSPTAVWHGRVFLHRKGLDVLCDAWAIVLERMQDSTPPTLVVVGTGYDAPELRRRLAAFRKGRIIHVDEYICEKKQIRSHLRAGDVYVFPSRHEGFPVAPVEAMALGLPVVSARAPGIPDIFASGEKHGGILVPTGDRQALADGLIRLLTDPSLAAEFGIRARRRALDAFSLDSVGQELKEFLLKSD